MDNITNTLDKTKITKSESAKAVMFVPYTEGSELAKRMREAEKKLESMTGYKIKIVERSGTKLEDTLCKADPWQGQDCQRDKCLLCQTKSRTGKHLGQDCSRRSLVYETWCMNCYERDMEDARVKAEGNMEQLKVLQGKIKVYKYVGETARSLYERSFEHITDYENLSTKSHMLKHMVEMHSTEQMGDNKIGIKVIKYAKSAFERQIFESCEIQANRHHHLLNSRSEYNRCAVPRLSCKLGDKEYKLFEKELEKDIKKEESQVSKIRELVKARNRERNPGRGPPTKRRKVTQGETYDLECDQQEEGEKRTEKRKETEDVGPEARKKQRTANDIRNFLDTTSKQKPVPEEEPAVKDREEEAPEIYYGETEQVELVDWEERFKKHQEETREMEKEREARIERKEKQGVGKC